MNRKRLFPAALLPLAILPATIATACSTSNSSDAKAQVNQEVTRLNNLIQSGKLRLSNPELTKAQITTVTSNNDALIDLLDQASLALKRANFDYHVVELSGLSAADMRTTAAKTMQFKFKVISKTDSKQSLLSVLASLQYQVKAEVVPPTQPDVTAALEALKQKIQTGVANKTLSAIEGLTQDKLDKLPSSPDLLLTDPYTNWSEFVKTLDPTNYQYKVTPSSLKVVDSSEQGKKEIQFTITITNNTQTSKTTTTDMLKLVVQPAKKA